MDAYQAGLTVANALNELRPKSPGKSPKGVTEFNLFHVYFLYLWLTNQWDELSDAHMIPDLTLVTGRAECAPHCLRRIREHNISWVEYALPYHNKQGLLYLWQPLPKALNPLFSYWLTHHGSSLRLTPSEKEQLFWHIKDRKWRTPQALRRQHMLRKDHLLTSLAHQAAIDPFLSTIAKTCLSQTQHHRSAASYQALNSNQIRYEIFTAHNRYFERLAQAINSTDLKPLCDLRLPTSQKLVPLFSTLDELPPYLKNKGEIVSFHFDIAAGTHTYVPMAPHTFGSTRALATAELSLFFDHLRQQLREPPKRTARSQAGQKADQEALRLYYNARTFELSLLFVLLTGTRPTHHISIETSCCFELKRAMVRDKGRYRSIELCDYFSNAIQCYLTLQRDTLATLNVDTSSVTTLWFLIGEKEHNNQDQGKGQEQNTPYKSESVRAKTLRHFFNDAWQTCFAASSHPDLAKSVVTYQLRHSFAQHALMASHPKLSRQQIDLLMGHSEQGEHLGQAYSFAGCNHMLTQHLNRWPEILKLRPMT